MPPFLQSQSQKNLSVKKIFQAKSRTPDRGYGVQEGFWTGSRRLPLLLQYIRSRALILPFYRRHNGRKEGATTGEKNNKKIRQKELFSVFLNGVSKTLNRLPKHKNRLQGLGPTSIQQYSFHNLRP
jgi:hypothetical protein